MDPLLGILGSNTNDICQRITMKIRARFSLVNHVRTLPRVCHPKATDQPQLAVRQGETGGPSFNFTSD